MSYDYISLLLYDHNKELQIFKNNQFQFHSFLSLLTPTNGSLWKSIQNKTKRRDTVPLILNPNNFLAKTDNENRIYSETACMKSFNYIQT